VPVDVKVIIFFKDAEWVSTYDFTALCVAIVVLLVPSAALVETAVIVWPPAICRLLAATVDAVLDPIVVPCIDPPVIVTLSAGLAASVPTIFIVVPEALPINSALSAVLIANSPATSPAGVAPGVFDVFSLTLGIRKFHR
jgi:hypothetical protein